MVLRDALNKGVEALRRANIEAPVVEAGVMLCSVLGCDRVYLYSHNDRILSEGEQARFFEMIRRRTEGMPVQYITGHQEFMSLDFMVKPGVLIPRQDTELLVEAVIKHAESQISKNNLRQIRILDIGTGSGCIAVSLAYYIKDSRITAVDISEEALEIARVNAVINGVGDRVTFLKSDIFSCLEKSRDRFDIIVSNPPYIPTGDISGLQAEVRDYEPSIALDGGCDGLDFYRAVIKEAPAFLEPGGFLAFEVGYNQAGAVSAMMDVGFSNIQVYKDLSGIDRVVAAQMI